MTTTTRVPTRLRNAAIAIGLGLLSACAPTTGAPATTEPTSTIPPQTNRIYMTDHVRYPAVPSGVDEVAVSMNIATPACSDYDSCSNGVRRSTGYVWFSALGVNLGTTPNDPDAYGMHGGLAFGGSGQQSQLYLDWSGYCPNKLGGNALRDGGSPCRTPNANPTFKPHTVVGLQAGHWYRLAVRKTTCAKSDVTDVTGPLTGWKMVLIDEQTSAEQSGGVWCLPNAPMITEASFFQEVIEPRGPCVTDFRSAQVKNARIHQPAGWSTIAHTSGHYNGNETELDADCANANLRTIAPGHIIDERMTPKGSNGGITGPGYLPMF